MKRNELTTVSQLQVGDRFYKKSDKGSVKDVYQMMKTEAQIRLKSQKFFMCPVLFVDSRYESHATIPVKGETQVIFLRNINSNKDGDRN